MQGIFSLIENSSYILCNLNYITCKSIKNKTMWEIISANNNFSKVSEFERLDKTHMAAQWFLWVQFPYSLLFWVIFFPWGWVSSDIKVTKQSHQNEATAHKTRAGWRWQHSLIHSFYKLTCCFAAYGATGLTLLVFTFYPALSNFKLFTETVKFKLRNM